MNKLIKPALRDRHADALKEFNDIISLQGEERKLCLSDRRFYSIAGAQYEGALCEQFKNKPKLEINKIHLSILRIISEYRNNRISVKFSPKDGQADDKLADVCRQLYRSDEKSSNSDEAYDNAFEEGVGGGVGAWRYRAVYEDDTDDWNDKQRILIEPIFDADSSVYFNNGAKRQDKSDAKSCFVINSVPRSEYIEQYDDDPVTWPSSDIEPCFDWASDDSVYIAEYYLKSESRDTVHVFEMLDGSEERYKDKDFEGDEGLLEKLMATGAEKISEKKVRRQVVKKYLMSGGKILEFCGEIPGGEIPIVPFYGKRWFIDNIERCMGHVRLCRDAQILKNVMTSKLLEVNAQSSIEKPIFAPVQVDRYANMWSEDSIDNFPYLYADPLYDDTGNLVSSGPAAYTRPPQIPPATAALLQVSEQDIHDLLGGQEEGEKIRSNLSGKAVELIQNQLGMQSYIYISNFAKAKKRGGEIWLGMARELFVEPGRKMKTVEDDDQVDSIELYSKRLSETGVSVIENNISAANFECDVEIGPSSSSKRDSTVRSLMEMMQATQDPKTMQVISSMIMMNMDGEGVEEVRAYFRGQLIKIGVVKPTEKEQEELQKEAQDQKPDPNAEYLRSAAIGEQAKAMKSKADAELAAARTDETRAKTIETLSGIGRGDQEAAFRLVEALKAGTTQPRSNG